MEYSLLLGFWLLARREERSVRAVLFILIPFSNFQGEGAASFKRKLQAKTKTE